MNSVALSFGFVIISALCVSKYLICAFVVLGSAQHDGGGNKNGGFSVGSKFVYDYSAATFLGPKSVSGGTFKGKPTWSKLTADIQVDSLWTGESGKQERLLRLSVFNVMSNDTSGTKKAELEQNSVLVHQVYGRIFGIYAEKEGNDGDLNLLRGISSLFQFQSGSMEGQEVDVSGECTAQYNLDHHGVHKRKRNCVRRRFRGRNENVFDLTREYDFKALYKLNNDALDEVESVERISGAVALKKDVGWMAKVKQKLTLKEQGDSEIKAIGSDFEAAVKSVGAAMKKSFIKIDIDPVINGNVKKTHFNLKNLITGSRRYLRAQLIATEDSTKAFVKLLDAIKTASTKDVQEILEDKKNKDILNQIMDLMGYSGSYSAYQALKAVKVSEDQLERYYWALSQTVNVDEEIVKKILSEVKKGGKKKTEAKVSQTLHMTLSSIVRNSKGLSVNEEIINYLIQDPFTICEKMPNSDASLACKVSKIKPLRNVQNDSVLKFLVKTVQENYHYQASKKVAIEALKCLQFFPSDSILKAKTILVTILEDEDAASTLRTLSAELILKSKPSTVIFDKFLKAIAVTASKVKGQEKSEFATFCLNRMFQVAQTDAVVNRLVKMHISSGKILNWDLLSRASGLSSAFSRSLASTASGEARFAFGVELSSGIFKRSSFEVTLEEKDKREREQLLQLDVFAGGIASYMGQGGEGEAVDDDPEVNGGLELRILGNSLRPFVFFESTSDLMSIYWSGRASEMNSALQAVQLLQDSKDEPFVLSNGAVFSGETKGCVSYDFSGKADVSLWEKVTQSLIESKAALLLRSEAKVDLTTESRMEIKHEMTAKAALHLETDIDFSDGDDVRMCIRMHVPEFPLKCDVRKSGPGSTVDVGHSQVSKIPAKTLFLNDKNCELCNIMFPKNHVSDKRQ